jgi:hypothetical protein
VVLQRWLSDGPTVARGWLNDGPEWFGGESVVAQACLGSGPILVQLF